MPTYPKHPDDYYDSKLSNLAPNWQDKLSDSGLVYDVYNVIMTCEAISQNREHKIEYNRRAHNNRRLKAKSAIA